MKPPPAPMSVPKAPTPKPIMTRMTAVVVENGSSTEATTARSLRIRENPQATHRNRWEAGDMSTQRILVVDDEPSIVDAVATALRYEGFEVDEATGGREALRVVAEREPDLVVLDWMLPDLEGIEVGRRMRERGFKSAILFLTAKDAVENKVEALRVGGDDYVTKPFSLAEIVARVQAILRRSAGDLPGDALRYADLVL